jgi:hypothetical protein
MESEMKSNAQFNVEFDESEGGLVLSSYADGCYNYQVFETRQELVDMITTLVTEGAKLPANGIIKEKTL